MSNPRKHCELIKAWADGATIQYKTKAGGIWLDVGGAPTWLDDFSYRIKPREFKEGAFYPAILFNEDKVIVQARSFRHDNGDKDYCFDSIATTHNYGEEEFIWIGEPLPEALWEKEDD